MPPVQSEPEDTVEFGRIPGSTAAPREDRDETPDGEASQQIFRRHPVRRRGGVLVFSSRGRRDAIAREVGADGRPRGLTRLRARGFHGSFERSARTSTSRYSEVSSDEPTLYLVVVVVVVVTRSKLHLTFQPFYVLSGVPDDDAA